MRALAGSLRQGVSTSNPSASPRPAIIRVKYSAVWPFDHGATAPCARVRSGSGTTSSGSTSLRMPRPLHSGQAP
ncbi:Uncharacterised protein [Mycobacterium tuberculosis]|uniref:Uncharacterized protein n=1 Tax=Mycobacterium tuberculosis TaxID=1773 RepID=A0A0U0U9C5_MYCTX|nr:Uncharacterised protein [Mycobacterium tuberculosis]COV08196.1 Uncharacterised protein [Mycobacterium tuberculosis]COY94720.1 Uncharacterised protein [Mycobacterium tuberculosis]